MLRSSILLRPLLGKVVFLDIFCSFQTAFKDVLLFPSIAKNYAWRPAYVSQL